MEKIKFSIIVPVYNASTYLADAIESVICQSYKEWELLLIDDGSTDDSKSICEQYQKRDNRIKLISKKNEGVSATRNIGLERACGKYVVFLDADDWMSNEYLEFSDKVLKETDADLLVLNYNEAKGICIKSGIPISETLCTGVHENRNELITFTLELASGDSKKWYGLMRPVWAKVFKKSLIEKSNLKFDPKLKYGEDTAFLLAYLILVKKIAYRNECVYYYRNNAFSVMNNKKWEGSTHGEHYFSVVENIVGTFVTDEALAKFWFNISENDWRVLSREKVPYKEKIDEMTRLFSSDLYIRFTRRNLAKKFNKKQQIEAFIVRNHFCGALLLMYQLLEKKRKGKSVYVHFFSEQNYGDDVFVHILTSRYPNNSFIISGTNDNLSAFEKQNNILVCKENRLISKVNKAVKKILKIDPLYYLRAYNCAVCLTIGGSIFIEPEKKYLNTYFRDKKCKFYPKKKNMILGANFGPYSDSEFSDFFRKEFQRYDLVTFRDWDSYTLFKSVPCVKYAPDILFGLESIYKGNRSYNDTFQQDYVVISVINTAKNKQCYINKIVEIVSYYELHGFQCVLLSLCHKQGDYDLCAEILNKACADIKIVDYDGDAQKIMSCIKNAKYVIASRFHAIITSFVFDVPCFPVAYSNKTSNMLKDIRFEGHYCNIDDLTTMSMEYIDYNRIRMYKINVKKYKRQSEKHFEQLDEYLY